MAIMKIVIFDGTQSQKWFENKSGTNRIFIVSAVNKQTTPPNKKNNKTKQDNSSYSVTMHHSWVFLHFREGSPCGSTYKQNQNKTPHGPGRGPG